MTQRIFKAEGAQAVFMAAMRSDKKETSAGMAKVEAEFDETSVKTKDVIQQSRDLLDKLDKPSGGKR